MKLLGTVIIDLHDADSFWTIYRHDGQSAKEISTQDWTHLQTNTTPAPSVHVIVPGEFIRTTEIKVLKNLKLQELQDSIPFILEDELLSDLDETLCLPIEKTFDDRAAVAIVNKPAMTEWLAKLSTQQIIPAQLYPDYFALPYIEHTWVLLQKGDRILIRMGKTLGLTIAQHEFQELFPLILAQTAVKPLHIAANFDLTDLQPLLNQNHIQTVTPQLHFPDVDHIPINLLQNEFQHTDPAIKKSLQRWTVYASVAFCLTIVMSHLFQYYHWSILNKHAQAQIQALYLQAYPASTDVINPDRIESEYKSLLTSNKNSVLIQLLHKTGYLLQKQNDSKLLTMNFQDNHLILTIEFADFAGLDHYKNNLISEGVGVQQEMAINEKDKIKAKLVISWKE